MHCYYFIIRCIVISWCYALLLAGALLFDALFISWLLAGALLFDALLGGYALLLAGALLFDALLLAVHYYSMHCYYYSMHCY